jgi:hypothetical protein
MRPFPLEVNAGNFALPAGHRLSAVSPLCSKHIIGELAHKMGFLDDIRSGKRAPY